MLLKFYHQSLRCWMHFLSTSFYFNLSCAECSFALPSRYLVQTRASRIGGHMKYVINYRLRLFSDPSHLIYRCKSIHLIACSSRKFDRFALVVKKGNSNLTQNQRNPMRHATLLGERSKDFGCVTIKFALYPIRICNILTISLH